MDFTAFPITYYISYSKALQHGSKLLSESVPYYLTELIEKCPAVCPVFPPLIGMKLGAVCR